MKKSKATLKNIKRDYEKLQQLHDAFQDAYGDFWIHAANLDIKYNLKIKMPLSGEVNAWIKYTLAMQELIKTKSSKET